MEDNGKTTAIVAHITLIGWIVALIMNNDNKKPLASFYLRQMLGLLIMALAGSVVTMIPLLGWIVGPVLSIGAFVLWIISLINAANERMEPIPLVGEYFQDWFRSL